jgi:hypothetical protein
MLALREDKSENEIPLNGASLALAVFAVVAFALQVFARRIGELAGFSLPMGVLLIAASIGAGTLVLLADDSERRFECLVTLLVITGCTVAFALVFREVPDPGWDSQTYHLPSMMRLIAGWRPLIEPTNLTLSNAYPNGGWTLLAGFAELFGFESGRAINLVLMLSAGVLLWKVLCRSGVSATSAAAAALVLSANPVAISQLFTALADGLVWYLTIILLMSMIIMLDDRRWIMILSAISALILLINAKISGLYFAAITTIVALILLVVRSKQNCVHFVIERRVQIISVAIAFWLSIGFVGWRPYMTNLIEHRTFLYPAPDQLGYRPEVGDQVPTDLLGGSRSKKIASLFFARTDVRGDHNEWKVPGTFSSKELSMDSVTRVGGFGPLFGAATVLGIVTLLGAVAKAIGGRLRPDYRAIEGPAILLLLALVTTIFFPEPWWARFVPVAWVIPSTAAILALALIRGCRLGERWIRICLTATLIICALNSVVVGVLTFRDSLFWSRDIKTKLERLAREPGPLYLSEGTLWSPAIKGQHAGEDVWRHRLQDLGRTDIVVVARERCQKGQPLSVDVMQCATPDGTP